MRRRKTSRKSTKLTPSLLFVVLGVGLIGTIVGNKNSDPPAMAPMSSNAGTASSTASSLSSKVTETYTVPSQPEIESENIEIATDVLRYVNGRKVALSLGPGKQFGILDRYDTGRELKLLEEDGGWAKVRDGLTLREGWIASSLLLTEKSEGEPKAERETKASNLEKKSQPYKPTVPSVSDATIVQRIIAGSISMYSGSCACPYSTDRRGRRCGNRSAYSKPGGYAPVCFAGDVSADMIQSFRAEVE